MRRLVVASAILATLLGASLGPAAAPVTAAPATDSERAVFALSYLWAAQKPDGSIGNSIAQTADLVIGTAAAGYDPSTLATCDHANTALGYIAGASDAAAGDAAKTGKAILAVVAAGGDPASFQGRDLMARLTALYHPETGAYGDGSTFGESFAILGVAASGATVPPAALAALKSLQDPDGSWSYGSAPVAAGQGDTNSTAIALMALDAAGDHAADAAALAYLHDQQLADGGFPYQNSPTYGPPFSDPQSAANVIQALLAAGQDPESSSWLAGTESVLTYLRSVQDTDGGFGYPGMSPDAFTTSQIPAALMRVPYAGAVHWTAGRTLPFTCIDTPATASPPPTPTARPTVRPTARPTPRPTAAPTLAPTLAPTEATITAEPAPTAAATPAATGSAAAGQQVEGVTFEPSYSPEPALPTPGPSQDSLPPALLYAAVAVLGLALVVGAGWLYLTRPWQR
jgi:hypothetical protein